MNSAALTIRSREHPSTPEEMKEATRKLELELENKHHEKKKETERESGGEGLK